MDSRRGDEEECNLLKSATRDRAATSFLRKEKMLLTCFAIDGEVKKCSGHNTILNTHPLRLRGKASSGGESLKSIELLSRSMTIACKGIPYNSYDKNRKEQHTFDCSSGVG